MKPIDLAGFEQKFAGNADPWSTFTNRDEAHKRGAILHGLGPGPVGRVLELAAGNGSNSVALARRALRLDATEGSASGVALVRRAVGADRHVRVRRLVLPGRFPAERYDAVVVAEVLFISPPARCGRSRAMSRRRCAAAGGWCSRITASIIPISSSMPRRSTRASLPRPARAGAASATPAPAAGACKPMSDDRL